MNKNFICLTDNYSFAKLRGYDLQDLLVQTENYFLEYRDSLGLPATLTFGVEIEYEGLIRSITDKFIEKNLPSWDSKKDGSLTFGGEISSPIMTDKIHSWRELKLICNHLSLRRADTLHNAGGHIHIGVSILNDNIDAWKKFLKLYTAYESVLFRFMYGDKICGRKNLSKYAPPIADYLYESLNTLNNVKTFLELKDAIPIVERHAAINFSNVIFNNPYNFCNRNTLEFRFPNATTSEIIWQNNINALAKMMIASKDNKIDEDFLDYRLKNEYMPYSTNKFLYDIININSLLEFVDLVFDNNLDKIYFLRQYLRNFQEVFGAKTTIKTKSFFK